MLCRRVFSVLFVVLGVVAGCGGGNHHTDGDAGVDAPPDGGPTGPEEVTCATLPPVSSGTCEVTAGGAAKLIEGEVLAPATIFHGGQVLVDATGQITCTGCNCAQGGETVISCPGATISPGLINTHDHITFTQNPPYNDTGERYDDRQQWRKGLDGHTKISTSGGASADDIRWGELRFLMGGATSTVGSGGQPGLLRNLDSSSNQEGLNHKAVQFTTFPLGDSSGTRRTMDCDYGGTAVTASSLSNVDSYEPHTAEGVDNYAHNEFQCESSTSYDTSAPGTSDDLLLPKTAMIHAIGLTAGDYGAMANAHTGLIWSPRSNITLYGDTARVTTAARFGVEIALGTDWLPSGSMNMLRELACADSFNQAYLDHYFSDYQLWQMVTTNAAAVTATDDAIGLLAPGHVADIAVFAPHTGSPFRAVIEAEPKDVALVMRGGKVLYGDQPVVDALDSGCDAVDVCSVQKSVCLSSEIGKTYADLQTAVGSIYPAFSCGVPAGEPTCVPSRPTAVAGSTVFTGAAGAGDQDGDGVPDASDNCPAVFNPVRPMDDGMQPDADGDGVGDACDVCPVDANTTSCTVVDPNDRDHDGVPNASDNCPEVANPGQSDGDSDGKGDACDACPSEPNPGTQGCPTTIYKIKQGIETAGSSVHLDNVLVTGKGSNGFFVQVKETDAGYTGADNSGLFVYTGANAPTLANAIVGQRVTIDASVALYQGEIELDSVASVVTSTTTPETPPAPITATYAEVMTGGTRATALEGVIVKVGPATVTAIDATYGELTLTSTGNMLVVDDFLYATPNPTVGMSFVSVTGILAFRQMASKLEPRDASDEVLGAPVLSSFGPQLGYVRQGQSNVTTFPAGTELTVTLSGPAQGNTDVAISSGSAAVTVANGKVTIPDGQTSAQVVLSGVSQATDVALTATLGMQSATAHVRVLGTNEAPTAVTVAPSTANVAPAGQVAFTVSLDIPAAPGGTAVALGVTPSNAGTTTPAGTLTVPANTLSSTFTYTDVAGSGSSTVGATLGASTSNATVSVTAGASNLVINEVDYDMVGTDNAEFVEIYNPTGSAVSLTDVALVLINGATNLAYPTETSLIDLSSVGSLAAHGYLVIAGQGITVSPPAVKYDPGWTSDAIQNGSPDGLALVDTSTHTLIDALSYEGSITMADVPGLSSAVSLVEGTALAANVVDSNTAQGSLCRSPNGTDTDNANADWKFCSTATPGTANP